MPLWLESTLACGGAVLIGGAIGFCLGWMASKVWA